MQAPGSEGVLERWPQGHRADLRPALRLGSGAVRPRVLARPAAQLRRGFLEPEKLEKQCPPRLGRGLIGHAYRLGGAPAHAETAILVDVPIGAEGRQVLRRLLAHFGLGHASVDRQRIPGGAPVGTAQTDGDHQMTAVLFQHAGFVRRRELGYQIGRIGGAGLTMHTA